MSLYIKYYKRLEYNSLCMSIVKVWHFHLCIFYHLSHSITWTCLPVFIYSLFQYDLLLLAQLLKSHHANKQVQGRHLHLTQLYLWYHLSVSASLISRVSPSTSESCHSCFCHLCFCWAYLKSNDGHHWTKQGNSIWQISSFFFFFKHASFSFVLWKSHFLLSRLQLSMCQQSQTSSLSHSSPWLTSYY